MGQHHQVKFVCCVFGIQYEQATSQETKAACISMAAAAPCTAAHVLHSLAVPACKNHICMQG